MDTPVDPRDPNQRQTNKRSAGRNTKSFDPKSTLVRPDMRIRFIPKETRLYQLSNDDVVLFPGFIPPNLYNTLLNELCDTEFISWAEGQHLQTKTPEDSPMFNRIVTEVCTALLIEPSTASTRFNWYKDDSDWKALHFDSAAFNKERSKVQNITAAVSLGEAREVVFNHAKSDAKIYIPQEDGMMYTFGRDVNIRFQHGINAVPLENRTGKGRISIVVWGYSRLADSKETALPLINNTPICRDFIKGQCRFGEKCRFSHDKTSFHR